MQAVPLQSVERKKSSMGYKLKNTDFKAAQRGPCGTPGFPPCPDEFNRMVRQNSSLPKSYKKNLRYSDAGVNDNNVRPVNIINAVKAENARRVSAIKGDPGYKALTQNKQARPVVNRIDRYLDQAVKKGTGYYIPTMKEAEGLLSIGRQYTKSKNIMKDIGWGDAILAKGRAEWLFYKYPNLERVAKGYGYKKDE